MAARRATNEVTDVTPMRVVQVGEDFGELAIRILMARSRVAVVGLGYVGLPLLMTAARTGFPVIGFDVDPSKIERLRATQSYVPDVRVEDLRRLDPECFGSDPARLSEAEVIVICVPTPLSDREPDLSMVQSATEIVAEQLSAGQLVILESTTYPGTTEDIVRPILEKTGLGVGVDIALGYSPERIDPGQDVNRIANTPKIVSGVTATCRELAAAFYGRIAGEIVRASSPREAEMAKLIENTFRQVNIALVNELAMHARDLGVDIWESIDLASTKPFGFMPFWPGPGVGGHCIAIDPSYLSWRVGQKVGYGVDFIEHANEVNRKMPGYVVSRIGEALNELGKPLKGSRILVLGVAYKAGVNDDRESPSLEVLQRLKAKGALVSYHDPYVREAVIDGERFTSVELSDHVIERQDAVAILTAHPGVDHRRIVDLAGLVFDARGITKPLRRDNLVRL